MSIELIKPEPGIYILGRKLGIPLKRSYIVLGSIQVIADVQSSEKIDKVEFYVDDELLSTDKHEPYTFHWLKIYYFDNCELKITAYSTLGQKKSLTKTILRII